MAEEETHVPASPPPAPRTCQPSLVSARARGGNTVSEAVSGWTSPPAMHRCRARNLHGAGAPGQQGLVVPDLMSRPLQVAGFPPGRRAGAAFPDTRNRHEFRPPRSSLQVCGPHCRTPPRLSCGLSVSNVTTQRERSSGFHRVAGFQGPRSSHGTSGPEHDRSASACPYTVLPDKGRLGLFFPSPLTFS